MLASVGEGRLAAAASPPYCDRREADDGHCRPHCRIVGRPGRAPALDRFLAHVKSKPDVWVTTRAEIARHWHEHHSR